MEEKLSSITHWVNHLFSPLALSLLHALRLQPADYDAPIPEYVVMSLIVLVVGTLIALILRARLSVDRPGALQQTAELLLAMKASSSSPLQGPFPFSFCSPTFWVYSRH
jgi:hypothetical protein